MGDRLSKPLHEASGPGMGSLNRLSKRSNTLVAPCSPLHWPYKDTSSGGPTGWVYPYPLSRQRMRTSATTV